MLVSFFVCDAKIHAIFFIALDPLMFFYNLVRRVTRFKACSSLW